MTTAENPLLAELFDAEASGIEQFVNQLFQIVKSDPCPKKRTDTVDVLTRYALGTDKADMAKNIADGLFTLLEPESDSALRFSLSMALSRIATGKPALKDKILQQLQGYFARPGTDHSHRTDTHDAIRRLCE